MRSLKAYIIALEPDGYLAKRTKQEVMKLGFKPENITIVQGVNGRKLKDEQLEKYLTPRAYFELNNGRYEDSALSSKGAIGCYLSHMKVMRMIINSKQNGAVFEDDFMLNESLSEKDADKFYHENLSKNTTCNFPHGKVQYGTVLTMGYINWVLGGMFYIVDPCAAQTILKHGLPTDTHVDWLIYFLSEQHLIHRVISSNNFYKEDINTESRIKHTNLLDTPNASKYKNLAICLGILCGGLLLGIFLMYKNKKIR